MEKGSASSLFVNDGSFMERFKQLQQEKGAAQKESKPGQTVSETSTPKPITSKTSLESKVNVSRKFTPIASSGKLAFSLKQKSKLVAASVKLSEDEGEEENDAGSDSGPQKRLKLGQPYPSDQSSEQVDVAPPSPTDPTVKKVADKLASFVAKNGRQFEHITRQKNPGDTPFKFLFDESCADYKYYEHQLSEEKKALSLNKDSQTSQSGVTSTVAPSSASMSQRSYQEHSKYQAPSSASGSQRSRQQHSSYQTPASALYESGEDIMSVQTASSAGESSVPADADPIARMEFYMKKAAQEERRRQPKHSKDEMPPPASLQGTVKKGHHMGDYIPPDELAKFLASCNDVAAQKAAKEVAERSKIQSDNVGHKLLSKMGWKEGEGLGSSRRGIADPIKAGDVKRDHLGVGAHQPGEVTAEDDIYEQYKKRMMLGYKYRPNPLNNPRKAYY
ncbi:SURP and G-patch domain-containing protein 1-like protein [Diospyros lotus]|uniref:SURP and G-patch domain-containing protein 1-like protein n=1 Tax=Diospyros lotus TaxID=55363 RepID=UPI00224E4988|nr:SURP and G-patch domain-containing protein 1-like protein [Diospyros lotus]XP_052193313.1 SURP and G-patch domain-containing protein 1-like protein [Diospyros lotus]XP_052193314.1 SURP and G-patch domain-containing protein 1-like protein [Diospyros lotus]